MTRLPNNYVSMDEINRNPALLAAVIRAEQQERDGTSVLGRRVPAPQAEVPETLRNATGPLSEHQKLAALWFIMSGKAL